MALSRLAREFADEIKHHDWSDAPWRMDRAGHQREHDSSGRRSEKVLDNRETRFVKTNVMYVVAQVLGHSDPNFNISEFARACGAEGQTEGTLRHGMRRNADGSYESPLRDAS